MPELPEVETVTRGLKPLVIGTIIKSVVIRNHSLRYPIVNNLPELIEGQEIIDISRRGKYIIMQLRTGNLIIHLGMTGTLRILDVNTTITKHDHIDMLLENNTSSVLLRYNDARRFGSISFSFNNPFEHKLIKNIGIEPLDNEFTAMYLKNQAKNKNVNIKTFIMNGQVVAGVGNIYATESLFMARIHPLAKASSLSLEQFAALVKEIKDILLLAIEAGGTTLKDYRNSEGKPGYFSQNLKVYGRAKLPCVSCQTSLTLITIGQRSTVFCPECQKQ
jgi:formamidopyrimidine-DNA glycosylase